ncbi:MAG TPA: phage tail protein [Kofleriaceae bacterium]|nr:phage tail protein [Kofleriaceae bacterium]
MSPLVQPALSFNFLVTMWDVQGPGFFGIDGADAGGWGVASRIASGVVNLASQILLGAFSEVGGLTAEMDIETYHAGGENGAPKRFRKTGKHPNLVLKRGVTFNTDLWDWHQQVLHGADPVIRKSGIVLLLERAGFATAGDSAAASFLVGLTRPPVAAWFFERGLPERLIGPALEAKSNTVAVETLEIAHEGLTRVSLAAIPGVADAAAGVGGLVSAAAAGATAAATALALGAAQGGADIAGDPPPPAPGEGTGAPPAGGADIAGDPPPPPPGAEG